MFGKRPTKNRVLGLIDFENIWQNIIKDMPPPERFSLRAGFDRLTRKVAQEVGEIANVFIFVPPHLASNWGGDFHEQGFFTISCPKIKGKVGEDIDTTDQTLIDFGKYMIDNIQGLTHLCIGSGDKDFSPLARFARRKGLRVIVIAASERSLASDLIRLADKIFIFSPTEN